MEKKTEKRVPGISISTETHAKLRALQFTQEFRRSKLKEIATAAIIRLYDIKKEEISEHIENL